MDRHGAFSSSRFHQAAPLLKAQLRAMQARRWTPATSMPFYEAEPSSASSALLAALRTSMLSSKRWSAPIETQDAAEPALRVCRVEARASTRMSSSHLTASVANLGLLVHEYKRMKPPSRYRELHKALLHVTTGRVADDSAAVAAAAPLKLAPDIANSTHVWAAPMRCRCPGKVRLGAGTCARCDRFACEDIIRLLLEPPPDSAALPARRL